MMAPARRGWTLALLALCCAAAVASVAPWAWANWLALPALAQVKAWQRTPNQPPSTDAWQQVRLQLDRALAVAPGHGELQEAMGYLYLSAALRPDQLAVVRLPYLRQASVHLGQALQARPMVPSAWANQALALHWRARWSDPALANAPAASDALLWQAFDRAMQLGQREGHVQRTLADVALARWGELGPTRQQAMRTLVAQATPPQRQALRAMAKRRGQESLW
jgi:hypothetical protein